VQPSPEVPVTVTETTGHDAVRSTWREPIVFLFLAAFTAIGSLLASFRIAHGSAWCMALWFLAGIVAVGLLSHYLVKDAQSMPLSPYGIPNRPTGKLVAFWTCAVIVSFALLATSLQVGLYFGGWSSQSGWWPWGS
jgi:hypothetical protein